MLYFWIWSNYYRLQNDHLRHRSTKGIIWCTYFVHKKDYVWYIGRQNRSYYELNFSYRRVYTFSYSSTFLTIDTSVTGDLNFLCDWIWCLVFLARAGIIQLDGLKMSCKIDSAFLHKLYHMYICRCLTQSLSCSSRCFQINRFYVTRFELARSIQLRPYNAMQYVVLSRYLFISQIDINESLTRVGWVAQCLN
jgi:hypothetical protein